MGAEDQTRVLHVQRRPTPGADQRESRPESQVAWQETPEHERLAFVCDDTMDVRSLGHKTNRSTDEYVALQRAARRPPFADSDSSQCTGRPPFAETGNPPGNGRLLFAGAGFPPAVSSVPEESEHRLLKVLGKGGMGNVYLAEEASLGRRVAYKSLHADKVDNQELVQRFVREVQITAQLDHPGIVPVYSLQMEEGQTPAYTMKVVEGATLQSLIEEIQGHCEGASKAGGAPLPERLSLGTRLEHFLKICDAVSFAHSKGVLHRDLKPDNIMVGRFGETYVVDWGIARLMDDRDVETTLPQSLHELVGDSDTLQTQAGRLVGTPRYMSPEQAQGQIHLMDERSDLYALGLILFELVYLKPAIAKGNFTTVLYRAAHGLLSEPVLPFSRQVVPRELEAMVRKATALCPEQRYPSVADLADDIRRFLRDEAIVAAPDSRWEATLRKMRRHQKGFLVTALLLFLSFVGANGWWLFQQQRKEVQSQRKQRRRAQQLMQAARQGHLIDRQFFRLEALLDRLAQTTRLALSHGQPSRQTYHLHRSFAPPDLRWSPFYRDRLSVSWPVIKLAPGTSPRALQTQLQRLALLQSHLRRVLFDSAQNAPGARSPALSRATNKELRRLLVEEGLPLLSSFVATREGVMMLYPGRGSYPAAYDPRKRPWFRLARGKRGFRWSAPYVSSQKIRAVLMACTTSVFDDKGRFRAVVGLDMRLNYLHDVLQRLAQQTPWADEAVLLDAQGHVIVDSAHWQKRRHGRRIIQKALDRSRYSHPELLKRLGQGAKEGFLLTQSRHGDRLLVFVRLQAVPWTYVIAGKIQ